MRSYKTQAGTVVVELTGDEHHAFLDREVEASVGMSSSDFAEQVQRGAVDWDDPDVFYAAGILGIGQNGHHSS